MIKTKRSAHSSECDGAPRHCSCGSAASDAGFTLTEMVIAVTVVLVLAGAALLAAPGILGQARKAACEALAGSITNAVTASYAKYLSYSGANDLVPDEFLVASPETTWYSIGPATAKGVTVSYGPECQDDFAPTIWAADSVDNQYTFGGCAGGGPCKVGDTGPGGGKIVYVAAVPQSWGEYLEVAPAPLPADYVWGCDQVELPATTFNEVGAGADSTQAILAAGCPDGAPAAEAAVAYAGGGLTDWHLPSQYELNQVCLWKDGEPTSWGTEFTACNGLGTAHESYWSSTQQLIPPNIWIITQDFNDGQFTAYTALSSGRVWPVRTF